MMNQLTKAIVVILVLLLTIVVIKWNNAVNRIRANPIMDFDSIDFNTGDIILLRRDHIRDGRLWAFPILGLALSLIACSAETHSGVVIMRNNVPYLYQVAIDAEYDYLNKKFVTFKPALVDLRDYAMTYPGEVILYRYQGVPVDNTVATEVMMRYADIRTDVHIGRWANTIFKIPVGDNVESVICSELASDILSSIGALSFENPHYLTSPFDIKRAAISSDNYSSPVLVGNLYLDDRHLVHPAVK
jgi:hypothetical protein